MHVEGADGLLCFIQNVSIVSPTRLDYRPCSAVDKGAMNFQGRVGNEDPNC
jgi:hypothetical protein